MINVTDKIREEILMYLEIEKPNDGDYLDEFYSFYYRCMKADMHYLNADEYAILNTLLNYDIGIDNYWAIAEWMDEHDYNIFDLDYTNKSLVSLAVAELGLNLDFSKWISENYKEYKFFE